MRNSRTSRPRLAPSADRIDVSRSRRSPLREQQVRHVGAGDEQQHGDRRHQQPQGRPDVAGHRVDHRRHATRPSRCSRRDTRAPAPPRSCDISRCACSTSTPSRSRATTPKPGWFARSSCIGVSSFGRCGNQTSTLEGADARRQHADHGDRVARPCGRRCPTIAGSPPKRRCHTASVITATSGVSGSCSSRRRGVRAPPGCP